jgi:1,2-diacylglycerol 3-beta-galactosyltransferase
MTESKHVVVIYTDAGGGHRAAAQALREILESEGQYRVTLVNPYVELMPDMDLFHRLTGHRAEAFYNETILRNGHTGLVCWIYYMIVLINFRLSRRPGRRVFLDYFKRVRPDMVVTDLPMLNGVIMSALADYRAQNAGAESTSGVVLITDWTEISRQVWFPRGGGYHAICGTEDAYGQASRVAGLEGKVHRTHGLLLKPAFLAGRPTDRKAAREALGLAPNKPVVCLLYGSGGGRRMREIGLNLRNAPPHSPTDIQVLFLCGRDADLAKDFSAIDWPFPVRVVGFTDEVPRYLGVSDIFVGKPGPGCVSEALAMGLSLLLDRTMALPQEKPVLRWLKRSEAGLTFSRIAEFRRLLDCQLAQIQARSEAETIAHPNSAAAEIPGIFADILRRDAATLGQTPKVK